jgi:multicomponent Na+:H+ antiporter subunit C
VTATLPILAGVLFAAGTYLVLQRPLARILLGLALLGHGANLLLLSAGGRAGEPAFIADGGPPAGAADPLPQALVLTAIVITFAVTAFLAVLAYRAYRLTGSDAVEDDVEDRRIAREKLEDTA